MHRLILATPLALVGGHHHHHHYVLRSRPSYVVGKLALGARLFANRWNNFLERHSGSFSIQKNFRTECRKKWTPNGRQAHTISLHYHLLLFYSKTQPSEQINSLFDSIDPPQTFRKPVSFFLIFAGDNRKFRSYDGGFPK